MRLLKYFSKLTAEYYPEILGKCFIINAPFIFTTVFAIVKGWLDEKTRNKIKVYGSNYQNDLFTFCPPSSIPKSFDFGRPGAKFKVCLGIKNCNFSEA